MSENPVAEPGEQVITRGQSLGITASSIIGAAAVFVVTIIVSRVLTEATYVWWLPCHLGYAAGGHARHGC